MKLTEGKWPWLLFHEAKINWRNMATSQGNNLSPAVLIAFIVLLAHFLAFVLIQFLPNSGLPAQVSVQFYLVIQVLFFAMFVLMMFWAMFNTLDALFESGEIEILLMSPISTKTVFVVRALYIMLSSMAMFAVVALPIANVGLFTGWSNLMALYPVLLALGMLATSLAMVVVLTLVSRFGIGTARRILFFSCAFGGAALLLLFGLSGDYLFKEIQLIAVDLSFMFEPGGALGPQSAFWFLARAGIGEWIPLLSIFLFGFGAFVLTIHLAHKNFLLGLQYASEHRSSANKSRGKANATIHLFGLATDKLWWLVISKEWRLMYRSPEILLQTLMQAFMLAVMILFFLQRDSVHSISEQLLMLINPACILFAGALAARVTWLIVSAEESPSLLASAPISAERLKSYKLLAALIPVWLLVLPLVGWKMSQDWLAAIWLLVVLVLSTASIGVLNVWNSSPGLRQDVIRRGKTMDVNTRIIEGMMTVAWAVIVVGIPQFKWWGFLALGLVLMMLFDAWRRGKAQIKEFGY